MEAYSPQIGSIPKSVRYLHTCCRTNCISNPQWNDSRKTQKHREKVDGSLPVGFDLLGDHCITGKHCARCSMSVSPVLSKPFITWVIVVSVLQKIKLNYTGLKVICPESCQRQVGKNKVKQLRGIWNWDLDLKWQTHLLSLAYPPSLPIEMLPILKYDCLQRALFWPHYQK